MITQAAFIFIVSNFCQFKDSKVTRDYKEQCMEALVNCVVERDGLISNKKLDECRERWVEQQRRQK